MTQLTANYTCIHKDSNLEKQLVSLYALDYPKHLFNFNIYQDLPLEIKGVLGGIYKKRISEGGHFTTDLKLSKKIKRFTIFAVCTNLFNKKYNDNLDAEMPGTWFMSGIEIEIR